MKKEYKILMIPIVTIASYVFNDNPNPDLYFQGLSFVSRMKYYYRQMTKDN